MSYHTEGPAFDDPAGRPHEEIGEEDWADEVLKAYEPSPLPTWGAALPCQHEWRSVNFSTCYLQCQDCGQNLLDLNGWVSPALRVKR